MKSGDIIKIRNKAGLLTLKIERELSLWDVSRGIGDDKLPEMKRPRLEYHQGRYGEHLVTLCDESEELPSKMYVLDCTDYAPPLIFLGVFEKSEEDENIFETITHNGEHEKNYSKE